MKNLFISNAVVLFFLISCSNEPAEISYPSSKKIDFTEEAQIQINKITQSDEKKYFRITVQGGGCSGFKYNFGFDKDLNDDDIVYENAIIDKTSLDIIAGSVVDFKKEMIGESFVITNPKATASCGCGLSFSV